MAAFGRCQVQRCELSASLATEQLLVEQYEGTRAAATGSGSRTRLRPAGVVST